MKPAWLAGLGAAAARADRVRRGLRAHQGRLPGGQAELGAYLVAVGMVDLAEDAQGFAPRPAGGPGVAGAVVDIAEAAERVGLVEPVGEVTGQRDGPFVARDRLPVVAPLMMGIAEAVPHGPLPVPFSQLPHGG